MPTRPDSGQVVALWVMPRHREPSEPRTTVSTQPDFGLEGDAHARPGSQRQVLLIDSETLREFQVAPGALKENITTVGIELSTLPSGSRLRVGGVLLEITMDCAPCGFVDSVQPGLRAKLEGRRGMLARVLEGGSIRVGDTVRLQN